MFPLTVHSNDLLSKKLFPLNTNTSFTIQLPTVLNKDSAKKWTMKVINLSIPKNICNF